MSISDKLREILQIKSDIKDAIIDKGVEMPAGLPFDQYASKVSEISSSSGYRLPTLEKDGYSCVLVGSSTILSSDNRELFSNTINQGIVNALIYTFPNETNLLDGNTYDIHLRYMPLTDSSNDNAWLVLSNDSTSSRIWLDQYDRKIRIVDVVNGDVVGSYSNGRLQDYLNIPTDFNIRISGRTVTITAKRINNSNYTTVGSSFTLAATNITINNIGFGRAFNGGTYNSKGWYDLTNCYIDKNNERIFNAVISE